MTIINTFIHNKLTPLGVNLVSTLVLVGCASPESSKDDDSASGPVVTVPTAADLVGTWTITSTYDDTEWDMDDVEYEVTVVDKDTYIFDKDGGLRSRVTKQRLRKTRRTKRSTMSTS